MDSDGRFIPYRPNASERALLLKVNRHIHLRDTMNPYGDAQYFATGLSAIRNIDAAVKASGVTPTSILDLPCGYGRVLRFLKAKYPKARLTASDIDREGVDFCASALGAVPLYSAPNFEGVRFEQRFNLIWVGSLLTHLDAERIKHAVDFLGRQLALGGLLIFTTHGENAVGRMSSRTLDYGVDVGALLESYQVSGYGYAAYAGQDYGISLTSPAWIRETMKDWRETYFSEAGWGAHQDVFGFVKA